MQEKFSKLFAALLFTALLFGLALPSHSAAAEEIPTGVITFTASDGLDTATTGVVVAITANTMTKGTGGGNFATYSVYTSATESGARTLFISGVIPGASNDAQVTVTGLVPGKLYWFWVTACDSLNNCSSPFVDSGWQMVTPPTNESFKAESGYVGIRLSFDKSAAGLPLGGSYKIYRKLLTESWPVSVNDLVLTTPLASLTTAGNTGTIITFDLSAKGWLLDKTEAPQYDYLLLTCGPDKCETSAILAAGVDLDKDKHAQRPQPGTPGTVTTVGSTTDATITVTWSANSNLPLGPDSAGAGAFDLTDRIDRFYAQRTLGAVTQPVPPVSFDRYTFSGIDRWASANTVYTYSVWACSTGTENCSEKKTGTGSYLSNPVVSGLVASDGNVVNAAGDPVVYITWPAPAWPVVINPDLPNAEPPILSRYYYNLYRSDDPAGLVNLTVKQRASDHLPGATLFYYDTTGNLGQTYYYYVRACLDNTGLPGILGSQSENGEICYDPSNVDSGWAPIPAPSITLTNSTSGVTATWSETDVNISYLGFRSPTSSFADAIPAGGYAILGLTGTDTTGVAGTTYYYFLKACLGTRCSEPSVGKPGVKLLP